MTASPGLSSSGSWIDELTRFIGSRDYPCTRAKAALGRENLHCLVTGHMACSHSDMNIVGFLHAFVDHYRVSNNAFTSAVVIFAGPNAATEATFDTLLWTRLQALADVDAETYAYDPRVSADPASPDFSFCIKSEALYVIGLHPGSSRKARRFSRPALVFNPHQQFEWLRTTGKYESMKRSVRNRDLVYAGSVNPMLADFGAASEASQYSGKKYDEHWKCPFISRHGRTDDHTAAKRSGLYDEKGTTTGGNGH